MNVVVNENGFGAMVHVSEDCNLAAIATLIKDAIFEYQVLVIRTIPLNALSLIELAKYFGRPLIHDFAPVHPEHPGITIVHKKPEDTHNFGGTWHSDNSYLQEPPKIGILYAIEVPRNSGDTVWSDQYSALDRLCASVRNEAEGSVAIHRSNTAFPNSETRSNPNSPYHGIQSEHPIIARHPVTNKRHLYHSGACTFAIKGESAATSDRILKQIYFAATNSPKQFRHKWQRGDIVLWDNLSTMHKAMNDYRGQERLMYRVSVK